MVTDTIVITSIN
ncbi:hypothetical protein SBY92_002317 [Candida maltosa Xu316]